MKRIMAIFALAIMGAALIGCTPTEEPKKTDDTSAGKMEEKPTEGTPPESK